MIPLIQVEIQERIRKSGIIAVLVIDDSADAVTLARILYDNGISAMELTLRTDSALESLKLIKSELPEMLSGIGTILSPSSVLAARDAGAEFGVAPGYNSRVVEKAAEIKFPFAPGISVPSEIELAVEQGCRTLKFFHAEGMGGAKYLKGINSPYGFLNLNYIPLGGLSINNIQSYLEMPEVLALGGSWIASRELIKQKNWDQIARNAVEAVKAFEEVRG